MTSGRSRQQLLDLLAVQLGQESAIALINALGEQVSRHDAADGILLLLEELTEQAPKAAKSAIDALTEMQRRGLVVEAVALGQ